MSTHQKIAWGTILTALGLAGSVALFVARAQAEAAVGPVRERLGRVETQQTNTDRRIDEMASDVRTIRDCLINGACRPKH